jgi:hypothetical protein
MTNVNSVFNQLGFEPSISSPTQSTEIFPGVRTSGSTIPGISNVARNIAGPATSEFVASAIGAPADIIHTLGGPDQGRVENLIHEYAGSEGIKKRITEPLREKFLGIPNEAELSTRGARKAGQLLPYVSPGKALLGTAAYLGAQEAGLGPTGQAIAEAVGTLSPSVVKGAKSFFSGSKVPKTMASGLQQPRAVGAKFPQLGTIPKEFQKEAIDNLNAQASKLTKSTLENHAPLIKDIEKGVDFQEKFKKDFGTVKKLADKYNPTIDITPLSDLMQDARKSFQGIPKLSPQSIKIKKEAKAFSNHPPTNLKDLLSTYRENNKKLSDIFEKSKIYGKNKEYTGFLQAYNQEIARSIKNTLPKDSPFVKLFENSNSEYSNYLKTLKSKAILEPLLGKNITPSKIERFATDVGLQKRLAVSLGDQGAKEVAQIANDLKTARNSLKGISVNKIKSFEDVIPAGYVLSDYIPGGGFLKKIVYAKYAKNALQKSYGFYLTQPATRRDYAKVLEAFNSGDTKAFGKATHDLAKSLEKPESFEDLGFEETFEDLGFEPS